jgi:hypothetical protein
MTRLRPVVVPVAALALATAAPSATAQPRRPVTQWANTPSAHSLAAELADLTPRAALVQPATSLPLAVLFPSGEAAVPDVGPPPAGSPPPPRAAGRPLLATARGPPR